MNPCACSGRGSSLTHLLSEHACGIRATSAKGTPVSRARTSAVHGVCFRSCSGDVNALVASDRELFVSGYTGSGLLDNAGQMPQEDVAEDPVARL